MVASLPAGRCETFPAIEGAGRLILVLGASGAGKDSVMRAWQATATDRRLRFARRIVTRPSDAHEPHEAVDGTTFERLRETGQLATWWHAHGHPYGVRVGELSALAHGCWVVLNGSRAHLPQLRRQAPGLQIIEITAADELRAQRLALRARETATGRQARMARRVDTPLNADLVVANDADLEASVAQVSDWWRAQAGR